MFWKLNRIQYPVYNLGNAKRIGIWVQGCSLSCKGCISGELQTTNGGKEINIEKLVEEISNVHEHFNGITITGGEPFQQYPQLIAFCAFLKRKTNIEIYVFSGYNLKELIHMFPDKLFMRYIDYLMDGRYVKELHDDQNIRGSKNQNFYQFIDGEAVLQKNYYKSDKFSLHVSGEQQLFLSGIPKRNEIQDLTDYLSKTGINITFE